MWRRRDAADRKRSVVFFEAGQRPGMALLNFPAGDRRPPS
jgi:hypothetical protein